MATKKQLLDSIYEIMKDLTDKDMEEYELRKNLDEMVELLKETGWLIVD